MKLTNPLAERWNANISLCRLRFLTRGMGSATCADRWGSSDILGRRKVSVQSVATAFPAVCFSRGVTNYLCKAITGGCTRAVYLCMGLCHCHSLFSRPAICLSYHIPICLSPPPLTSRPPPLWTHSVASHYLSLLPSFLFSVCLVVSPQKEKILDGVGTFHASRGDHEWPKVLLSACSQPEGTGACWSAQRREVERGWVYLISSLPPKACKCHSRSPRRQHETLRQLSPKSWKWKRTLESKGQGVLQVYGYFISPPRHYYKKRKGVTKFSLHLLILQSGSCEFAVNDSGWWSSELKMEMGCGPNRAWSILSSSPGLLTHTGVGPAGTPFCAFPGCIPRHHVPDGYKINPHPPPPPPPPLLCPALILTLTKRKEHLDVLAERSL